jgi:hypothetical protein
MKVTETPDATWQPWEILVDESASHPVKIRPEYKGFGGVELTGELEFEFTYDDYSGWSGAREEQQTHVIPVEVLTEALRRVGYTVTKE